MKRIKLYLDSSALWNLYYQESGATNVEHALQDKKYECSSSIWSMLELNRGIQKRLNQNEISLDDAKNLRAFIDSHLKQLALSSSLFLLQISAEIIEQAKKIIVDLNLYSADAVHLSTAMIEKCSHFIVDDYHFKRLNAEIIARHGLIIVPTSTSIDKLPEVDEE